MDIPLKLDNAPSVTQVFTPVNVAILTSLGIHGFVLGLALPNLQWNPPKDTNASDSKPVGVIELTPAEQSRLPNTAPLPTTDPTSTLLPSSTGTQLPEAVPSTPNLPMPPDSNYNYQLPTAPTIPPPPRLPNLPAYPNVPPLTSYGNLGRLPITTPPLPSLPPLPSQFPPQRLAPRFPNLPPTPLQNGFNGQGLTPGMGGRPSFAPLPPPQGTGFITRAPQTQQNGGFGNASEPGLSAEGEDTSAEQIRLNSLNSIAQQGVAIKAKDTVMGAYPAIACRNRTEASVVYNVYPSGQKDVVGRSRYPIFNQLAAQAIAGRSYAQPTQVTVAFQYDPKVCAGVTQFGTPVVPPQQPAVPVVPNGTVPNLPTLPSAPAPSAPNVPTQNVPPVAPPPQSRPVPPVTNPVPTVPTSKPAPLPDAPVPQSRPEQPPAPRQTPVDTAPTPSVKPAPVNPTAPAPEASPDSSVKPAPEAPPVNEAPPSPAPQTEAPPTDAVPPAPMQSRKE